MTEWSRYYDAAGEEPRETLLAALERFAQPGVAIDLGCGTGRDTVELLRRGWHVVAIDSEAEAIRRLRAKTGDDERLETQVARYEEAVLLPCELVNASWSLPFCPPEVFAAVWDRIVSSLDAGGRFCGQLFGDRDEWATEDDMTFHTRAEAEELLRDFELERFDEDEEDGKTALGQAKHWHVFNIVARLRFARNPADFVRHRTDGPSARPPGVRWPAAAFGFDDGLASARLSRALGGPECVLFRW